MLKGIYFLIGINPKGACFYLIILAPIGLYRKPTDGMKMQGDKPKVPRTLCSTQGIITEQNALINKTKSLVPPYSSFTSA